MASPGMAPPSRPSGSPDGLSGSLCTAPPAVVVAWQPLFWDCKPDRPDMLCFISVRHSNIDEYAPFGI